MARGYPQKTPENVAYAKRMRADGKKLREIAEHFGCAISTVDAWLQDPDGARARKRRDKYRGECVDCGAPTDGSQGYSGGSVRCRPCANQHQRDEAVWTPEAIVCAIQHFADEHGGIPPAAQLWNVGYLKARNQHERLREFYDNAYPHTSHVLFRFGTWNAAIAAAGFVPRAAGERRFGAGLVAV